MSVANEGTELLKDKIVELSENVFAGEEKLELNDIENRKKCSKVMTQNSPP